MAGGWPIDTVIGMSQPNGPMQNISPDSSGLPAPSMHALGMGAWASEIQMLRVLRRVADMIGMTLQEVSLEHREKTFAELARDRGVPRQEMLEAITAALRFGEPIGALWHQRDTAMREAERLMDEQPPKRKRREQLAREQSVKDQDAKDRRDARAPKRDGRGVDGEGHLDIRA